MLGSAASTTEDGRLRAAELSLKGQKSLLGCSPHSDELAGVVEAAADKGEAVLLGKGVFRYEEYPEAWNRLAEAMGWPYADREVNGMDLAEAFRRDEVARFPLGAVVCTVTVDDAPFTLQPAFALPKKKSERSARLPQNTTSVWCPMKSIRDSLSIIRIDHRPASIPIRL